MTADQVKALMAEISGSKPRGVGRGAKHGNIPTERDGFVFDSRMEANRWDQLVMLWRHGRIHFLERQVPFAFIINGVRVGKYTADYAYLEGGYYVVEDRKGHRDTAYKLRRRLMLACFGIEIRET